MPKTPYNALNVIIYIWPNRDKLAHGDAMDFITLMLSPSITSLEKPTSTANSKAFLYANTSTSSLFVIAGPFDDITTTTFPLLL